MRCSPEASLFITHSGVPPQVPGDVRDAREAEAPVAPALGYASEGSRPCHNGSEVGLFLAATLEPQPLNPQPETRNWNLPSALWTRAGRCRCAAALEPRLYHGRHANTLRP